MTKAATLACAFESSSVFEGIPYHIC